MDYLEYIERVLSENTKKNAAKILGQLFMQRETPTWPNLINYGWVGKVGGGTINLELVTEDAKLSFPFTPREFIEFWQVTNATFEQLKESFDITETRK